jgi:hypothetical protein
MVRPNSQGAGIETRAAHDSKFLIVRPEFADHDGRGCQKKVEV